MTRSLVRRRLGGVLAVLLVSGVAGAQDLPRSISSSLDWSRTRESRRSQAKEWLNETEGVDNNIATLSPSEAEWVKTEYDDELSKNENRYTPRSLKMLGTKEYAQREAKRSLPPIIDILRALTSTTPMNSQREVALWTQLCASVLNGATWNHITTLHEQGVLPFRRFNPDKISGLGSVGDIFRLNWTSRVRDITNDIILPYVSATPRR